MGIAVVICVTVLISVVAMCNTLEKIAWYKYAELNHRIKPDDEKSELE